LGSDGSAGQTGGEQHTKKDVCGAAHAEGLG
jgi:hypothetical protein